MREDKDHPLVASPTTTDHIASMLNMLQILFDVLQQTLIHLGSAVRWEQDPSLSKSHGQDLLAGVLLCTMLPTSALR